MLGWHSPWRRQHVSRAQKRQVVEEAAAVVQGRAADLMAARGEWVPWGAWVNGLAHRPPDRLGELRLLATGQQGRAVAQAALAITDELGSLDEQRLAGIRAGLLVPLELEILAGRQLPGGPAQVVQAVHRRLQDGGTGDPPTADPRR